MSNTLDLTSERGRTFDELYQRIVDEVKASQLWVIRPYPAILLVTPEQFNILRPSEDFEPQDALLWKTIDPVTGDIINVMDVWVKGVYEPKVNVLLLG